MLHFIITCVIKTAQNKLIILTYITICIWWHLFLFFGFYLVFQPPPQFLITYLNEYATFWTEQREKCLHVLTRKTWECAWSKQDVVHNSYNIAIYFYFNFYMEMQVVDRSISAHWSLKTLDIAKNVRKNDKNFFEFIKFRDMVRRRVVTVKPEC